jgi:phosphatidylglycerol:prolipoprotein diacylglycerol transferase
VIRKKMGFWRMTDLAMPGLALGIVIGRIGDLMIGDHLGKPTDFALGWRCTGMSGGGEPVSAATYHRLAESSPPSLGCFDVVVHQTALYDFVSTILLLALLLYLGRTPRRTGLLTLVFVVWYGAVRVATDFLRVDQRYFGLTGSQLLALSAVAVSLYLLARYRGAPPRWSEPPAPALPDGPAPPTAERDENPPDASPPPLAGNAP